MKRGIQWEEDHKAKSCKRCERGAVRQSCAVIDARAAAEGGGGPIA